MDIISTATKQIAPTHSVLLLLRQLQRPVSQKAIHPSRRSLHPNLVLRAPSQRRGGAGEEDLLGDGVAPSDLFGGREKAHVNPVGVTVSESLRQVGGEGGEAGHVRGSRRGLAQPLAGQWVGDRPTDEETPAEQQAGSHS